MFCLSLFFCSGPPHLFLERKLPSSSASSLPFSFSSSSSDSSSFSSFSAFAFDFLVCFLFFVLLVFVFLWRFGCWVQIVVKCQTIWEGNDTVSHALMDAILEEKPTEQQHVRISGPRNRAAQHSRSLHGVLLENECSSFPGVISVSKKRMIIISWFSWLGGGRVLDTEKRSNPLTTQWSVVCALSKNMAKNIAFFPKHDKKQRRRLAQEHQQCHQNTTKHHTYVDQEIMHDKTFDQEMIPNER